MSKAKTEKYIVTKPNVSIKRGTVCEVGDEIELTEAQAAARVNKIVKSSEYNKTAKNDGKVEALKTENAALKKQIAELEKQVSELMAAMSSGKKGSK